MSNKTKSLLFLSFFILSCVLYVATDEQNKEQQDYSAVASKSLNTI
ncbi:MAG: hypothetical protein NWQ38_06165 [Cellulophaga sp.]|nr:hypothetical protein [Cellulophaga sp.]